jgi:hypothetical protein
MPQRKPMTRCSPREPKLKEAEVGEGYAPGTTRKLGFYIRVESVIKTSTKKEFSYPPTFGDTVARTRSKIILP